MKKISTLGVILFTSLTMYCQTPELMSYQAVVRDADSELLTDQAVGMKISILEDTASGTPVYVETQNPSTNSNGLLSLQVGAGTVVSGDITTIDWANHDYFIKTETDPAGGENYTIAGTSQILSVPYALLSKNVINDLVDDADNDPSNEYNTGFTFNGTDLEITDGGSVQTVDLSVLDNTNLQAELDATQTGAGLATDGTYSANTTANYIAGATALNDADDKLDAQAKVNADAISANNTQISANSTAITVNTSNIATNVTDIAGNTTAISTNATDIATNATDIATNVTDIAGNTTAISTNATDIATNVTAITTNTNNIATNVTAIALNTAKTGITPAQTNAIAINTAKVTNATHTGDVTGATALTIANAAVTTAKILDANITDAKIATVSASKLTGAVGIANGGTNLTTYTQGDILYATSPTTLVKLSKGTAGQVLAMNTGATAPEWVDSSGGSGTTYALNTFYAELGGYVIQISSNGKHGLVVAMQDQGISTWYEANDLLSDPSNHDVDGKEFSEWRLPTKRELNLIYVQKATVGNFTQNYYWSSTENDANGAWFQSFNDGIQYGNSKASLFVVRAVRAF